jgi:hypothetical protein
MVVEKFTPIAWLFGATLVAGLLMALAGKSLQVPLSVIHKILALVCLFLLIRAVGRLVGIHEPPALLVAIAVFAAAFLVSFATGIVESIPGSAGALWLNLHRVAAAVAAIACAVAARFIVLVARP